VIYNGCLASLLDFEEDAVLRDMVVKKGATARGYKSRAMMSSVTFV
jgi:hypothetical protein